MNSHDIPNSVVQRMPRYFRYLRKLLIDDIMRISSEDLAKLLGLTAPQVRADLRYFGTLGQHGYGYNVKLLYTEISRTLGAGDFLNAVVISADSLNIMSSSLFEGRGVILTAVFSENGEENRSGKCPIYPLSELETYLLSNKTDIAVILPIKADVNALAQKLPPLGIRGVWNLTTTDLDLPVAVKNLPLGDILMTLCYEIRKLEKYDSDNEKGNGI